jgi:hypothetical protein
MKDARLLLNLHRNDQGIESAMIALHLLRNLYAIASEDKAAVRKAVLEEAIEKLNIKIEALELDARLTDDTGASEYYDDKSDGVREAIMVLQRLMADTDYTG